MADITVSWDVDLSVGDWLLSGADLATGQDLATAVLVSLFTDGRAAADDPLPPGTTDRRGWWGDMFDPTHPIGSKLWLYARSKETEATRSGVERAVEDALAWLIADGVVAEIDVAVTWDSPGFLGVRIDLWQQAGGKPTTVAFAWAWRQLAGG